MCEPHDLVCTTRIKSELLNFLGCTSWMGLSEQVISTTTSTTSQPLRAHETSAWTTHSLAQSLFKAT